MANATEPAGPALRPTTEILSSAEHYRAITESVPFGVVTADAHGRILYLNPAAESMFGPDHAGRPVESLVADRHRQDFDDSFRYHLQAPKNRAENGLIEVTGRRADGSEFPAETSMSVWQHRGESFITVVVRDISRRTSYKRDLERLASELRRSNAELEKFAYIASHDLQEPLRMVASYCRLLQMRYQGKLDADADEFLKYAIEGAKRMQQLINDLLSYSRVGTQSRGFAQVDVKELLENALFTLQASRDESHATVTHDPLPTITADATQLAQVFQNLLANAIKFRGDAPPKVHVSAQRDGNGWTFTVRDNGIGIDPRYHARIFDVFQRLHGAKYPGTGIGLSIVARIVERHGGRIWVESEPGKGAAFRFRLPDSPPPEATTP